MCSNIDDIIRYLPKDVVKIITAYFINVGYKDITNKSITIIEYVSGPPYIYIKSISIPEKFSHIIDYATLVVGQDLYLFGISRILKYSSSTEIWKVIDIPELLEPRNERSMILIDDEIFITSKTMIYSYSESKLLFTKHETVYFFVEDGDTSLLKINNADIKLEKLYLMLAPYHFDRYIRFEFLKYKKSLLTFEFMILFPWKKDPRACYEYGYVQDPDSNLLYVTFYGFIFCIDPLNRIILSTNSVEQIKYSLHIDSFNKRIYAHGKLAWHIFELKTLVFVAEYR